MIGAALIAAALSGAPASGTAPAAARTGNASQAANPPMGNVIVTVTGKVPLPAASEPLGKARGLAWASWAASSAAEAAIDSALRLAYLDEAEFRRDTEGLKPAQVAEVMRKRLGASPVILSDLAEGLAIGTGRIGAWLGLPAALEIHREGYFTGRFLLGNANDMEGLLRGAVRIRGLERELLARADCPPAAAERLRKRDTTAIEAKLADAAGALGMANADQKRRDPSVRILFSREIFPWLAPLVASHDFAVDKAGGGYLIPQTPADIAKLPPVAHPLIVFLDPAASARALRLLTPAQLDHRIAALARQDGLQARDYLAELVDARLTLLSILGKTLSAITPQSSPKARAAQPGLEGAYALIREEARQAAADLLGPADTTAGKERLEALRIRMVILGKFAAPSGNKNLIAWARNSAAALEVKP